MATLDEARKMLLPLLYATTLSDGPLLLSPLIAKGLLDEARKAAAVDLDVPPPVGHGASLGWSGFMTVPAAAAPPSTQDNNIFFWLQPCEKWGCAKDAPFVVWLQGGPGGPGTFGALSEIGNYYVREKKLNERCFSWCKRANCLFVDQPVMTGFSFPTNASGVYPGDDGIVYTSTSAEAMKDVFGVLTQVLTLFPEFAAAPLWITGESYGGQYISNLGIVIHAHNVRVKAARDVKEHGQSPEEVYTSPINFVGIAVGDPILNWAAQMPTYGSTLYGMGLLMLDEKAIIDGVMATAVEAVRAGPNYNCTAAFDAWNSVWNDDGGGGLPGLFAKFSGSAETEDAILGFQPFAFKDGEDWLDSPAVKSAMHYENLPQNRSFAEGGAVYAAMVASGVR